MTANAIVDGCYADLKLVKTRSVCQMVIEIPIERAEELVQKFGIPQPGQEIHVAVARLQVPAPDARPKETVEPLSAGAAEVRAHKSEQARERYQQLGKPEQMVADCAMLCADHGFQNWLRAAGAFVENTAASAAEIVRIKCGIKSRSELASNPAAARKWQQMVTDYDKWRGAMAEERS